MSLHKKSWLWIYAISLVVCFFFFSHTDALFTNAQSYTFFEHAANFYDYSLTHIGVVGYLPSIFLILAIWNSPFQILGILKSNQIENWAMNLDVYAGLSHLDYFIFISWYKILLIILSIFSIYLLRKISNLVPNNNLDSGLIFATSPFAIFSILIFSGYDILIVSSVLLGFYYYLKKDLLRFSLYFSLAITFKFFALIIFVPLLLLAEKRLKRLAKYFLIGVSFSSIYILAFSHNITFFESISFVAKQKLNLSFSSIFKALFLLAYFVLCIYCFKTNIKLRVVFLKYAIFIAYISCLPLFFATKWHPQWILLLIPFMSLSYIYIRDLNKIFWVELMGFISYTYLITHIWVNNVDQKMITQGPLSFLIPQPQKSISNLFASPLLKTLSILILYIYLLHPLLLLYFTKNKPKIKSGFLTIHKRFIFVFFFIFPSLLCLAIDSSYNLDIYKKSLRCIYQACEN